MKNLFERLKKLERIFDNIEIYYHESINMREEYILLDDKNFLYKIIYSYENINIYQIDKNNIFSLNIEKYMILSMNHISFEEREENLYNIIYNYLKNLLDY